MLPVFVLLPSVVASIWSERFGRVLEEMGKNAKSQAMKVPRLNAGPAEGTYSEVSKKLMASMGWTKGMGLGKDGQGIDEHLKAKKREENIGLGADSSVEAQFASGMHKGSGKASFDQAGGQWWIDSFAGALDTVRKVNGKASTAKKTKKDKAGKKMNFLDECFAATNGARLGMRARQSQGGKLRRTEGENDEPAPEKKKKRKANEEEDDDKAKTGGDEPETHVETREERKLRKKRRKEAKAAKAAAKAAA